MRIVLSRKGFDSQYGGVPSPILPDGHMFSLPIPHPQGPKRFREVMSLLGPLDAQLSSLGCRKVSGDDRVHLDPDLWPGSLPRSPGWSPAFGQFGAAQRHLENQGVGIGDLFLFFGWFREVGETFERLMGKPDLHVLYGWLQVGEIVSIGDNPDALKHRYPAYADHPHLTAPLGPANTLYVAAPKLAIDGQPLPLPGGGIFPCIAAQRVLTAPGQSRSRWALPDWFATPEPGLSYHLKPEKWVRFGDGWLLQSAPKGQEFVIDSTDRKGATDWLRALFDDLL